MRVGTEHLFWIEALSRDIDVRLNGLGQYDSIRERVAWSEFEELVSSISKFVDLDDAISWGEAIWKQPAFRPFVVAARLRYDIKDLIEAVVGQDGFWSLSYPIETSLTFTEHDAVITVHGLPGTTLHSLFLHFLQGQLQTLFDENAPTLVAMHLNERGAVYALPLTAIHRTNLISGETLAEEYLMLHEQVMRLKAEAVSPPEKISAPSPSPLESAVSAWFEVGTDAMIVFDTDDKVMAINAPAAALFGFEPAQHEELSFSRLLPEVLADRSLKQLKAQGPLEAPFTVQLSGMHRNHYVLPLTVTFVPFDAGFIARIEDRSIKEQDQTEKERLQDQLSGLQRMNTLGQLTSGIVHDFKNLLNAALAQLTELSLKPNDPNPVNEVRETLSKGSELTDQLLSYARGNKSQEQHISLRQTIEQIVTTANHLLPDNVELEQHIESSGSIFTDPISLQQVLLNLILNAKDAMPGGGQIVVGIHDAGDDNIEISVSDNGSGMDVAVQERIFEPLYSTKPEGQGTGLGLAIVADIVARMGGSISVSSEPGSGSTFTLIVPRAVPKPAKQAQRHSNAASRTILIADDDEQTRELIKLVLGSKGYVVVAVSNGEQAVDYFLEHSETIDLVILNTLMPKMTGIDAAEHILAHRPVTPVIFITDFEADPVSIGTQQHSSLAKPFSTITLANLVQERLSTHSGHSLQYPVSN